MNWRSLEVLLLLICLQSCTTAARQLQAEFVAEYSDDIVKRDSLAPDHPPQTTESVPGLPESCLTYEEKYAQYANLSSGAIVADPNEVNPSSRYVIIIRLHYGVSWRRDLVLHLRSMMAEASRAGMHIFLLFEDSERPDAAPDDTPEKFRHSIPKEFRPITFLFDETDVHNAYRKMHKYKVHVREYLPLVWFLHRFSGYKFAWYVEYDVRYTGPSIGVFLNALLQKAIDTVQGGKSGRAVAKKFLAVDDRRSVELPEEESHLPDLVLIGDGVHTLPVDDENKPRDYSPQHWNFTRFHHRQVQVMGLTRKLANALHDYSVNGLGGFIEEFVPSLAVETNMTVVSIPIAEYGGYSFHCCFDAAEHFYEGWYTSGACRQAALLHPIKLDGRLWKEQDVQNLAL